MKVVTQYKDALCLYVWVVCVCCVDKFDDFHFYFPHYVLRKDLLHSTELTDGTH